MNDELDDVMVLLKFAQGNLVYQLIVYDTKIVKKAINGFEIAGSISKSLAKELGRYDITVNTISLGLVKTSHSNNEFLYKNIEKILKSYPLKRIGNAEDVAPMVTFLCSQNANWITGQVISINGGFCMI